MYVLNSGASRAFRLYTKSTLGNVHGCVDLTSFTRVIDLSCLHIWHHAFFHRLVDCVLPNFELYELARTSDSKSTALVMPEAQRDFVNALLPPKHTISEQLLKNDVDDNRTCLLVTDTAVVTYETRTLGSLEAQQARAARFRAAINHAAAKGSPQKSRETLLFIDRRKIRELDNAKEFRAYLAKELPQYRQETYYGNETLLQTVDMFSNARIVVGFHGAGHANTIFCQNKTVVVELSWYLDEKSDKLWRSNNKVASLHGRLQWIVYALRLSESIPTWPEINKKESVSELFQNMKKVHLPIADALNVVNLVKAALAS